MPRSAGVSRGTTKPAAQQRFAGPSPAWLGGACVLVGLVMLTPAGSHAEASIGQARPVEIAATAGHDLKTQFRQPETIPFPPDDLYTVEKMRLGKVLYFDPRLSRTGTQSCATCHNPSLAYGDGLARGVGDGMGTLKRRTPSLVNVAWSAALMWDGRFDTLEVQALSPLQSQDEMNVPIATIVERLDAIAAYRGMFGAAFPAQPVDGETIGRALATYERTIASGRSPFDAWVDGDENAIPDVAKRGFAVFVGKGECVACHGGWNFTDNGFHDIGLPDGDMGRGVLFPAVIKMQRAFKTPSLREVDRRAPYMHDGSLPTLAAVIQHYATGGVDRPSRSELIHPIALDEAEQSELVAFLKTLTSAMPPTALPILPN